MIQYLVYILTTKQVGWSKNNLIHFKPVGTKLAGQIVEVGKIFVGESISSLNKTSWAGKSTTVQKFKLDTKRALFSIPQRQ